MVSTISNFVPAGVADFQIEQRTGDDTDHFATRLQAGVGDTAHQADAAPAVHEANFLLGEALSHRIGWQRERYRRDRGWSRKKRRGNRCSWAEGCWQGEGK